MQKKKWCVWTHAKEQWCTCTSSGAGVRWWAITKAPLFPAPLVAPRCSAAAAPTTTTTTAGAPRWFIVMTTRLLIMMAADTADTVAATAATATAAAAVFILFIAQLWWRGAFPLPARLFLILLLLGILLPDLLPLLAVFFSRACRCATLTVLFIIPVLLSPFPFRLGLVLLDRS